MDLEATVGVVAPADGLDGNPRAAERAPELDRQRRLAAAGEMKDISLRAMILILLALTPAFACPPVWVSRAHETGEQLLRARLFEFLIWVAFTDASVLVVVGQLLCVDPVRLAPTEWGLVAARRLFMTVVTFVLASAVVATTDSWGATAAAFSIVAASAAIAWFYLLGQLKGTIRFMGASLVGVAACIGFYVWTSLA